MNTPSHGAGRYFLSFLALVILTVTIWLSVFLARLIRDLAGIKLCLDINLATKARVRGKKPGDRHDRGNRHCGEAGEQADQPHNGGAWRSGVTVPPPAFQQRCAPGGNQMPDSRP